MKKILILIFLIVLLIAGLNGVAYGMHRLLPTSPSCVLGIDRSGQGVELTFLEKKLYIGK